MPKKWTPPLVISLTMPCMRNYDSLMMEVLRGDEHPFVWDGTVEGEAHGSLVGILVTLDATVAVVALWWCFIDDIVTAGNADVEAELQTFVLTLRQQESLRVATSTVVMTIQICVGLDSFVSGFYQRAERLSVRDGHVGISRMKNNVLITSWYCGIKMSLLKRKFWSA